MRQLTYAELMEWREKNKSFQLIDVREEDEHRNWNIGGQLIPLGEVLQHTDIFSPTRPVVIYCKRGIRSQIAIQRLEKKLPNVEFYNLQNGLLGLKDTQS
jgi:rhodanese-related sulfurtransferase